ncbi:MAG: sulfatase-like hydrolase/transferase, partial [Planctomycetes bacterium]|nr:sulfatase-like hydrolase/transferase [Planctomycetota bacterium]
MKHASTSTLWILAVLILTILSPGTQAVQPTRSQPNILFIYLDDFGWRDTSYMGSDFFETPHLDKLAGEGMLFTNAYSCASNCAPARACLLSGQYTPRHQIFNVGTGPRGKAQHRRLLHVPGVDTLDPKIRTWAHMLQQAGYRTATLGKW